MIFHLCASTLCGTRLVFGSQDWVQEEKTFVFALNGHLRRCLMRRPEQGPSRVPLLGLEFSMDYQGTKLEVLERSWGGVQLSPHPRLTGPLTFSLLLRSASSHFSFHQSRVWEGGD